MEQMLISLDNPPYGIRQKCEKKFDLGMSKPVFTFKNTIYNPFKGDVDDFLLAHEYTHFQQQGNDPYVWWDNYFSNQSFRFKQELKAYRVQYSVVKEFIKDRNALAKILFKLSSDLSSPMYGKMCKQSEAFKLINENS